ncbi:spore germination protein [Lysinibacillus sp. MHQ-1]|nr:spore germination protein [Lysinibacillus sp. MHQ-1]
MDYLFPLRSKFLLCSFFFDLFREAGIRLPKAVGQTVAVLGGLIVGDAAIRAGFTSPSTLVIGALTVISSYTLINQNVLGNVFFNKSRNITNCLLFLECMALF